MRWTDSSLGPWDWGGKFLIRDSNMLKECSHFLGSVDVCLCVCVRHTGWVSCLCMCVRVSGKNPGG